MNEIYIDVGPTESRTAILEDGELSVIQIERQNKEKIGGNIYKGVVENVLPGMQAAFINIGLEKNAFLYIKDVLEYDTNKSDEKDADVPINVILKAGEELVVQVSKEPVGSKGARVTTHITLPGRYIVLMPNVNYIGVSRKIEDEKERERLRRLIGKLKPEKMGVIIRTEAEGKNEEDFTEDINFLVRLWDKVNSEGKKCNAPKLIHKDLDLVYRSIRDLFNRDTVRLVVNEKGAFKRAVELAEIFSPGQKESIEYYDSSVNILEFYGIENKIEKALSRKVWLKSGGYIVIDHTEALTSIDVNTGKFTGCQNLKDTVLQTNMEAAREIPRQLKLRDIGGIIIIDFIDMAVEDHRNKVIDVLKGELKKDSVKTSVFGITQLGLVEMTRKKVGRRLSSILQKNCPVCEGSGRILDEDTILRIGERKIERIFKETDVESVLVEVNDGIKEYIDTAGWDYIKRMEEEYGKKIVIKGLSNVDYKEIRVKYMSGLDNTHEIFKKGNKVEISIARSKYLNVSNRSASYNGKIDEVIADESGKPSKVIIDLDV